MTSPTSTSESKHLEPGVFVCDGLISSVQIPLAVIDVILSGMQNKNKIYTYIF